MSTDAFVPPALADNLLCRAGDLRMLPAIAMQALDVANDPDCTIAEFTAVVEHDVKLASDLLRVANSSLYFRGGRRVGNLHQAVVRLGFAQCKNLIISSSVASLIKRMTLEEEWIHDVLWRHSFLTAVLAVNLNRALGLGFQGEEFTAGLIHDLGRILLAVVTPGMFSQLDPLDFDESPTLLDRERSLIGTTHADFGAWYAEHNRLPPELVEAVRYHHTPHLAGKHVRLAAVVAVADHMANHHQRTGEALGYDATANEHLIHLEQPGSRRMTDRFQAIAPVVLDESGRDMEEINWT